MFTTAVDKLLSQFFALSAEERSCILEVLVDSQPINNSDGVESFLSKRLDVSRSGRPACPHCGSLKVVKNGRHRGTQRFICRDCSKSFGWSSGSFFNHCKKEISQWFKYVQCFMDRLPLRECARRCGISLDTSFKWRHRLLDGLQKIHNSVKLTGVVEADEVYFSISYKGSRKFSAQHAGREPKKRGMRSTKRGLSDEKVCVPTAVNLEGKSTGVVCNLGKPTTANLKTALGCKILPGSTLVTDSLGGYPLLAESCKAKHVQIPSKKHKKGIFNIQLINYYHSALKAMTNIRFRGVATKYLNNYIVYNNFVTFAKESFMEKIKILKNEIFTIGVEERSFSVNISKRDPLPLLKDQYLL